MDRRMSLARLLQLASPTLPVGAFSYSQGLEWAVEAGWVVGEAGAGEWIGQLLRHAIGCFEAPLLARLLAAWTQGDLDEVARLNRLFVASRETAELRAETLQMGYSMRRLLLELKLGDSVWQTGLTQLAEPAFPTAWSAAAAAWRVEPAAALEAYLWAWAENQVMAAVKIVPLGQTAGQRLLAHLAVEIPGVAAVAGTLPEEDWSNWTPGLALASARHETQYTRLFRS